ncbi:MULTISPECIES: hypothetical protein [unclassified Marinovum]
MTKPVFIHAGAHRTGTSSFQMCLDLNREALAAAGYDTAYPGRDGIPGGTLRLKLPDDGTTGPAEKTLRQHSPDPTRALILSEENIPGRMFPFYKGRFYPSAEARLKTLRAALRAVGAERITRVVLVLRSYDALFASAYRKRAEDNPVAPFSQIVPHLLAMDRGWPAIVRVFKNILSPQELVVLDYSKRGQSCDLLRQLVPGFDGDLSEPERSLNLSATDAALEALQARYHAGETLDRAAWQAVIAENADIAGRARFASYEEGEKRVLSERYDAHLDRISRIKGITFLR